MDVVRRILDLTGASPDLVRHVEDRPGHDRRYALSCAKLMMRTGWAPQIDFAEGIARTIDWYGKRRDWWEPIKSGEFRRYYERMYGQRKVLKEVGP